ncbi:MAG: TdeIII family type II restriction endonuclease [Candidatus Staskawiczbacteria bacterium]|nr:TdeIII family type II restriction endonuclease [Candidatus Staskawiczbacteria bacterium]
MALNSKVKSEIIKILVDTVEAKLKEYKPETKYAPFHYSLLGRDRYAMFSFIQSINTTFGMSIWEQVAVILAKGVGFEAKRQLDLLGNVDGQTEITIRKIHHELRIGSTLTNKNNETKIIKQTIKNSTDKVDPDSRVDFFVKIKNVENYFDITSVKPNIKEFVSLKLKLLRWTALRLSLDKKVNIFTRLAIPYNPYFPEPYERWTLRGLYDLGAGEILVGEEFWNFIAGGNIYEDLIKAFDEAGKKLRPKLNKKFLEFKNPKLARKG